MKSEQERVRTLLLSTITQLCQNGLMYKKDLRVQGLLAITIDNSDILVVQLNENIEAEVHTESASNVEMSAGTIASKDFPIPIRPCDVQDVSRAGNGDIALRCVGQIDTNSMANCKDKTLSSYVLKSSHEPFSHEADHNKMVEHNIEFGTALVDKNAATDNTPMLLPAFTIPMTLNYSPMKVFQGSECYRDANSDQMEYVFPDFQVPTTAITGDPGRVACQAVSANSGPIHGQPEYQPNIAPGQSYQHFSSMISTPQGSAKLEMSSVGKRILPQATGGHIASFVGQGQVTSAKKPKQESRLPRRPRESTEKRFRCQLCSLTYYYKKHLKFHMQQKHGIQQNLTT